jgi:hypothetical protein
MTEESKNCAFDVAFDLIAEFVEWFRLSALRAFFDPRTAAKKPQWQKPERIAKILPLAFITPALRVAVPRTQAGSRCDQSATI